LGFIFFGWAAAAEPAIIAKARARIGSEAALDAVKSIHFAGKLTATDPSDSTKELKASVELVFQKPDRQSITAIYEKFVEMTALDGYEGWTRVQDAKDATKWKLVLLDPLQVKRLRANLWQQLAFFRPRDRAVEIEDLGPTTISGVSCEKVAFRHDPKIVFYKYFDVATGRVVLTETESGATVREEGEMVVDGLRFPKATITTTKNGDKIQTVAVTYEKITLNETFPAQAFAVPAFPVK
jgi:hypothetical protein